MRDLITDIRALERSQLIAEIERSKEQIDGFEGAIKDLQAGIQWKNKIIDQKDAEIVRLIEDNAHFAWRNADKNKLIDELVSALQECGTKPYLDLKERAWRAINSQDVK